MLLAIQAAAVLEIARRRFWDFCLYYDYEFFSARPFLKEIADAFQDIADGKILRLQVSMPPRAGKSYITTLFAAWMIGRNPTGSVMRNCCTSTLYEKFSYDTRDVIRSEKFSQVFPSVKLSDDKQSVRGWNTTQAKQVSYFGSGVGGTIIGFGATLVGISDDLFKSFEDAISEKVCESTWSWYQGTHGSRIEKHCPQIDIGTRWSRKDVIGRNADDKFYDRQVIVSALNEKNETFCDAVKTTEEYLDIRYRTPVEIWAAEYMQDPKGSAGVLFKREDFKTFKRADLNLLNSETCIAYGDISDEGTDHFCMPVGWVYRNAIYITDVIFTRDNVDVTLPLCAGMINAQSIKDAKGQVVKELSYARFEANNQGSVFIKMLRDKVPAHKILAINNSTNKHTRILMQYGAIKMYVYLLDPTEYVRGSPYDLFVQQLLEYVKAGSRTQDDAPDALSGLVLMAQGFLPHLFNPLSE